MENCVPGSNTKPKPSSKVVRYISSFMQMEAAGGIVLFFAAVLALVLDNSGMAYLYNDFLTVKLTIITLTKPIILWINDGLMAIFFFLVGLEIKREVLEGELNTASKAVLPVIAAAGGIIGPALFYYFINQGDATAIRGWAIPTATDIAFALGVLSLLGSRIPLALKVFLTALAIIDDLAAIVIIAIFYTAELSWISLSIAAICLIILLFFNRLGVSAFTPYAIVGAILWVCVLKSGVHATLAGVVVALVYPTRSTKNPEYSPSRRLEKVLHPWVAFVVLPLFAFANSGIPFDTITWKMLFSSISLGIAFGLFFGKQLGIYLSTYIVVKLKIARLPDDVTWAKVYGMSLICGVGFTMSLFIGGLAFGEMGLKYNDIVRIGVLMGSFVSGLVGFIFLRLSCRQAKEIPATLQSEN